MARAFSAAQAEADNTGSAIVAEAEAEAEAGAETAAGAVAGAAVEVAGAEIRTEAPLVQATATFR